MAQDKKATIQADPEIIVAEGKAGQLFVGDKETLILRVDEGSTNYTTDTQTVEAGITLKVIPKVFNDHIELTVTQQVSGIEEKKDDSILVKTREFSSVISLLPGQTMMVAGLTEKKTKSDESGTPILRKIPIVRFFFGHKKQEKSDSQLVLFLTAEVAK
jgi:type IV pilus assembly protein PilQ